VIDLISPRPVWQVPAETVNAIRDALGPGWDVVEVRSPAVSDGDGALGSDEAVRAAHGAELYMGWGVPVGVARSAAGTLRWAHSAAAGVRGSLSPEFRATGAALTSSRGLYAEPMADWVLAAIAFFARGFCHAVRAQREHRWAKDDFTDGTVRTRELADVRVGVVGLGGVGRAVARRCHALGMEVRAIRRRPGRRPPRGVRWVGGPDDLARLARESDVLVLATPHTPDTERLVDDRLLAELPEGALIVNVARGVLIDEAAVLRHLDGRLGGCAFDAFADEPLPDRHPFWDHPRVLVTPHVSGVSARYWEREQALIVENVRRYLAGKRLRNLVNPRVGY
jgi:phosphoglycerate dehydrogenase-like enzyme